MLNVNTVKGIIFDLDGTLINTSINFTVMKEQMISFLEENGIPKGILTPKQTTVVIIASCEEILREYGKQQNEIEMVQQTLEEIMNQG